MNIYGGDTVTEPGDRSDVARMAEQRRLYTALSQRFLVLGPLVLTWSWLQRWTVGYGYRPARALAWLLLLWLIGTGWFALYPMHCVPTMGDPVNYVGYPLCPLGELSDHLVWNPGLYNLDQIIPVVNFGNKNQWAAAGASQWMDLQLGIAGYVLTTTFLVGLVRRLRAR